jgi:hypothetical protein
LGMRVVTLAADWELAPTRPVPSMVFGHPNLPFTTQGWGSTPHDLSVLITRKEDL